MKECRKIYKYNLRKKILGREMHNIFKSTIGILGGMGPETTVDFFSRIIKICEKDYSCKKDEDFPKIVIVSVPIPPVVEKIEREKELLSISKEGIKNLVAANVDFIAIPCNTIHLYFEKLKKFSKVPLLNIVEEVSKKAREEGFRKVGIMATKTTIKSGLYASYLKKFGIQTIVPNEDEIDEIAKIIHDVEKGDILDKDKNKLKEIASKLEERGAEAVILGCTELPIVLKQEECKTKLLDSTQILAEATVKKALQYPPVLAFSIYKKRKIK
ncbi:MAG: aspartate/glutamate racemase family protein [Candidatus Micrarchaeia archaeon]